MTTEERVDQAIEGLFSREKALRQTLLDAADAEHAYRVRNGEEYLKADGSIEARKATAVINCKDLLLDRLRKNALKEFALEAVRDARQALSARQSLLKADTDKVF